MCKPVSNKFANFHALQWTISTIAILTICAEQEKRCPEHACTHARYRWWIWCLFFVNRSTLPTVTRSIPLSNIQMCYIHETERPTKMPSRECDRAYTQRFGCLDWWLVWARCMYGQSLCFSLIRIWWCSVRCFCLVRPFAFIPLTVS